jgi:hypothetical protein
MRAWARPRSSRLGRRQGRQLSGGRLVLALHHPNTLSLLTHMAHMSQSPGRSDLSRSANLRANTTIMNVGFAWLEVRKTELLATNRLLTP